MKDKKVRKDMKNKNDNIDKKKKKKIIKKK